MNKRLGRIEIEVLLVLGLLLAQLAVLVVQIVK